jgi:hypothetical protein
MPFRIAATLIASRHFHRRFHTAMLFDGNFSAIMRHLVTALLLAALPFATRLRFAMLQLFSLQAFMKKLP